MSTSPLISLAFTSSFTLAILKIEQACFAQRRVLRVSSVLLAAGLTVAIIAVCEFPPRLSFNSLHLTGEQKSIPSSHIEIEIKILNLNRLNTKYLGSCYLFESDCQVLKIQTKVLFILYLMQQANFLPPQVIGEGGGQGGGVMPPGYKRNPQSEKAFTSIQKILKCTYQVRTDSR